MEDKWWKYSSNQILAITNIYRRCVAYVNDDNYIDTVARICRDQGKLSDDGEAG